MRVREVMTPGVECTRPDATLQEAAAKMKARRPRAFASAMS